MYITKIYKIMINMLLYSFEKFKNCNINDINPEIIAIIKNPIIGENGLSFFAGNRIPIKVESIMIKSN